MPKERDRNGDRKATVRIFYAEVEGGDETIQDGLRSIAHALVRATQPPAPVRVVKPLPLDPSKPVDSPVQRTLFPPEVEQQDQVADEVVPEAEPPRPKEPRQRKGSSYSLVSDLNLRPADKISLKDFFSQKKPEDFQEQVAVFVHYLSRTLGVTNIGPNHLFTCFKDVNSRVPANISDAAAKAATRKGWIDVSPTAGYTPTTRGDNFIDHDLPKKVD